MLVCVVVQSRGDVEHDYLVLQEGPLVQLWIGTSRACLKNCTQYGMLRCAYVTPRTSNIFQTPQALESFHLIISR